jgi:NADH-quinone oxidoreductase subunit J
MDPVAVADTMGSDMGTMGQVMFAVCGVIALVTAIITITQRTPLRAAMALLGHILALSGLYVTLHAHLLAAIQLLVYAGAVVVLFVFVIMLIGPGAIDSKPDERGIRTKIIGAATVALLAGAIAFQVGEATAPMTTIPSCGPSAPDCVDFGGVEAVSHALFVQAAVPFELVSMLLLVAIIAAIAIARGVHAGERGTEVEERVDVPTKLPIRPTVIDPLPAQPGTERDVEAPAE